MVRLRTQATAPSFAHHRFHDEDPRSRAVIEMTAYLGVPGRHLRALARAGSAEHNPDLAARIGCVYIF